MASSPSTEMQHRHAELEALGHLVGQVERCVPRSSKRGLADLDAVAELEPQPVEQQRIGDQRRRRRRLSASSSGSAALVAALDGDGPDQRIAGSTARRLTKELPVIGSARPLTSITSPTVPKVLEQRPLLGGRATVGELRLEVAAQHDAGVADQRRLQRIADRADDGDGRHPERQAGEQNAEAAQVAAQVAERHAQPAAHPPHAECPALAAACRRRSRRRVNSRDMIGLGRGRRGSP